MMTRTFTDEEGFKRRVRLERLYAGTPVFRPQLKARLVEAGKFLWWRRRKREVYDSGELLVDFYFAESIYNREVGTRRLSGGTNPDVHPVLLGHVVDFDKVNWTVFAPDRRGTFLWLYKGMVYRTNDKATFEDIKTMVDPPSSRDAGRGRRERIPDKAKTYVWQRDKGECVQCGSRAGLEDDHIIPLSMGGSNTARNLQLLCETCNRLKGGNL
jgi:hypothetical protein